MNSVSTNQQNLAVNPFVPEILWRICPKLQNIPYEYYRETYRRPEQPKINLFIKFENFSLHPLLKALGV